MNLFSRKYTEEWRELLLELKRFFALEARYLALDATEKAALLLGAVLLILIAIFLGFLVLLTGAFALSFWLGDMMGSLALGFLLVSLSLFLLLLVVLCNKQRWIILPLVKLFASILLKRDTNSSHAA